MKTILITGINGFLGSHLAKRLLSKHKIIGVEYSTENLFRLKGIDIDVYNSKIDSFKSIFENYSIDIIIHTATFYGRNSEEISKIADTNLFMPFQLLDLAVTNKVKCFINTDTVLDRFVNAYSLTKRQFQEWLFFRSKDIKTINMQLEHFYGNGCSPTNFITSMITRLKNNEKSIDLTLGEQKRDFIYFDDIIDAYELVIDKMDELEGDYNNFEVGSGELHSIKEILIQLKELINSSSILNFGAIPYRKNELMVSHTDVSKLKALGWLPKTNLKTGLIKTVENR